MDRHRFPNWPVRLDEELQAAVLAYASRNKLSRQDALAELVQAGLLADEALRAERAAIRAARRPVVSTSGGGEPGPAVESTAGEVVAGESFVLPPNAAAWLTGGVDRRVPPGEPPAVPADSGMDWLEPGWPPPEPKD